MTVSVQLCPGGFCLPFQKESFAPQAQGACHSPGAMCPANSTVLWEENASPFLESLAVFLQCCFPMVALSIYFITSHPF